MPNRIPKPEMGVNLTTPRSLPKLRGELLVRDILLDLFGVGEVLLGLLEVQVVVQLPLVGA